MFLKNFRKRDPLKNRMLKLCASADSTAQTRSEPVSVELLRKCSTKEARALLPFHSASRFQVLPLNFSEEGKLTVACLDPTDHELKQSLRFALNQDPNLVKVTADVLNPALFAAYHGDDDLLISRVSELSTVTASALSPPALITFRPDSGEVARFVAALIDYGISHGASDIHVNATYEGTQIQLRLKGELLSHDSVVASAAVHAQIISRLKVLAALDTTVRGRPQDGSFRIPVGKQFTDVRVSILPTIHGERAVLRLMSHAAQLEPEQLGFRAETWAVLEGIVNRPRGALLFAGPTGCGKSTTMYAILSELVRRALCVVTIEDPVELIVPGAAQTSIDEKMGVSFASALRAVLRQDPDVILLGEIRDAESATSALQAALTGHLLLASVHGNTVFDALMRLRTLGVAADSIIHGVSAIVCQKLVSLLCHECKVFDLRVSNQLGFSVYKPVGCSVCAHSGIGKRVPMAEIIRFDDSLRRRILCEGFEPYRIKDMLTPSQYYPIDTTLFGALREGELGFEEFCYHSDSLPLQGAVP